MKEIDYYGSQTPKVVIFTENELPKKWYDYFKIPDDDMGIVYIPKGIKKEDFMADTKNWCVKFHTDFSNTELFITIGAVGKMFKPTLNLKKEAGKIYHPDLLFKLYKICHLKPPGYYKAVKMANEFKQMDDLKFHLMSVYKYGL